MFLDNVVKHLHQKKWIEALDKEVQDLLRNGVLEIVERTEIKQNKQLIPSLVVCTEKEGGTKKKCRLVAAGTHVVGIREQLQEN